MAGNKDVGTGGTQQNVKPAISWETGIFLIIFCAVAVPMASVMGFANLLSTLMNTAYKLLTDTVLYIMAVAVLAGAVSGLFSEFGVVSAANRIISPLIKPIYGLPGASMLGIMATYFSDNPAILTLADDPGFRRFFKKYQLPALTNLGTAFGMGMVITVFMAGLKTPDGTSMAFPALIGNLGAIVGSIVSVRLMLYFTKKTCSDEPCEVMGDTFDPNHFRTIRKGNVGSRFIGAMLDGGKSGVEMGMVIIPGVLIICAFVMVLTGSPSESGTYTGAAFEGIGFLPMLGEKIQVVLKLLFGFQSAKAVAVPITALGAAGAAIGLVPSMVEQGLAGGNDIAVFTAMCMCWSGYLSTHVAMMDSLHCSNLTGKAILSHTIGGLCAGISAHLVYMIINLL